jgi:NADP-dependent 3-hydroxy acid dehydrogenase YdfG
VKTLFITGGTSGIGEATARHAVAEGHQVYVTGRQRQRLDDFLASFESPLPTPVSLRAVTC